MSTPGKRLLQIALLGTVSVFSAQAGESLMRSHLDAVRMKKILEEREILVSAQLDPPDAKMLRRYHFYTAFTVKAGLTPTRKKLMDYEIYAKLIPYLKEVHYNKNSHILGVRGGLWNFQLASRIQFTEVSPTRVRYRIVEGHFKDLEGSFYFEPAGERGTLVYFEGEKTDASWPASFAAENVIEKGAEVVFRYTAKKMRDYVEESEKPHENGSPEVKKYPIPRHRL